MTQKKLLLNLLLFFVVILSVNAKDIKENNVPAIVRSYVAKTYPSATDKEWKYKDNKGKYYYKVEFLISGREVELEIDTDGKLLSSEEELPLKDAPASAVSYINKHYTDAVILGVKKKSEGTRVFFDIGIKYKNSYGNSRHRNIYFDKSGNVIKK